ncbi:MAG: tRNA (adenosine(37)-N6)-threonylcarbamoyltransferase complex dimerization subunit type 1 TsaB [Burkholderiales bacterium]|nr:MAG: tRNA (adenosine(37)-N6)-threonylcarbamoyltransferase complex dimerization subunit type 1 TsaB [Burkholderiales bacterium]
MLPAPDSRAADGARPTVLAIDTTAGACSVAVSGPGGSASLSRPMTQGHSRHVLELVDAVLRESGIDAHAVDAIGFGSGPGSFTGLRIACGIAQGLGLGWNRPLVPVDAMRTLAVQAAPGPDESADWVLVALDLRMGEVCMAAFPLAAVSDGQWPEPAFGPVLAGPAAAREAFEALGATAPVLAGDGFDAYPMLLEGRLAKAPRPVRARQPDAAYLARLTELGYRGGRAVDAADAAPTYLRDKVALDVGEQAALRAARAAAGGSR